MNTSKHALFGEKTALRRSVCGIKRANVSSTSDPPNRNTITNFFFNFFSKIKVAPLTDAVS